MAKKKRRFSETFVVRAMGPEGAWKAAVNAVLLRETKPILEAIESLEQSIEALESASPRQEVDSAVKRLVESIKDLEGGRVWMNASSQDIDDAEIESDLHSAIKFLRTAQSSKKQQLLSTWLEGFRAGSASQSLVGRLIVNVVQFRGFAEYFVGVAGELTKEQEVAIKAYKARSARTRRKQERVNWINGWLNERGIGFADIDRRTKSVVKEAFRKQFGLSEAQFYKDWRSARES